MGEAADGDAVMFLVVSEEGNDVVLVGDGCVEEGLVEFDHRLELLYLGLEDDVGEVDGFDDHLAGVRECCAHGSVGDMIPGEFVGINNGLARVVRCVKSVRTCRR